MLAAVAAAISQTEREAALAHKETGGMQRAEGRMQVDEPAQASDAERQAEARRRATAFLQGMGKPGEGQSGMGETTGYARRAGKEPVPTVEQDEEESTPP
jgi:hypothetical protein